MISNVLKFNKNYGSSVQKYSKKDGILAIILFIIFISLYCLTAILEREFDFINNNIIMVGNILNLTIISITILFVVLNKQSIKTIGIIKGNWKKSIIIGLILGFIFFMTNFGIDYLMYGGIFKSPQIIISLIIYYLIIAFCEEIVFRGFIQTRMYGVIGNRLVAILIVALMFAIMHLPYRMIAYGMTLQTLVIDNFSWFIQLVVMHIIWSFIYSKTNSIYGSIISHWVSNLAGSILT